jgi:hypothetical protein
MGSEQEVNGVDGLMAVSWTGVNVVLTWAVWRLCRRVFPHDTTAQMGIHTLVVLWAAVTLACFVLGTFHLLSGIGVFGGGVVLAALALGLLQYLAARGRMLDAWPAEASAPQPYQGFPSSPPAASSYSLGGRLASLAWLCLLSFWAAHVLTNAVAAFPRDWDSLMYHLPLIDHWLQAGSLYAPDCSLWYNASTNELLGMWIVAPFSGDFLGALNNLPACLLLALSTLELARNLNIRLPFDHLLALAVTATQVFYKQLFDNENDIAVAGLFLTCLVYGLRYLRGQTLLDLVLAAVTLGLLAGIKYYAVGYAVVAWTGLTLCVWLQESGRAALTTALVGALGGLVFCGYWYGRNIWLTGAPFFPMGFSQETNQLQNFYPDTWSSTFLGSGRSEVFPLAQAAVWKLGGPCHLLALLGAPLTLGWLIGTGVLLRARPEGRLAGAGRLFLAFLTAGAGAVLLVTPWAIETEPGTLNHLRWGYSPVRFGQSFLSLAVLALGMVFADLTHGMHWLVTWGRNTSTKRSGWVSTLLLALGTSWPALLFAGLIGWQMTRALEDPFLMVRYHNLDAILLALNGLIVGLVVYLLGAILGLRIRWGIGVVLLITASAALAWAGEASARHWHANFAQHYDRMFSTCVFTDLAERDPSTIRLCALNYRYYPFFGSRRQVRLCRPMKAISYEWLTKYLREQRVNVVVSVMHDYRIYGRYCDASLWIRDHPEVFIGQQEDNHFVWARIDRDKLAEAARP